MTGDQPQSADDCPAGHAWSHHVRGGEPITVPICYLCGAINWPDIAEQVDAIRERIAATIDTMAEVQADLMDRRKLAGLDDQAREAAVRSRAFGLAAEAVRSKQEGP